MLTFQARKPEPCVASGSREKTSKVTEGSPGLGQRLVAQPQREGALGQGGEIPLRGSHLPWAHVCLFLSGEM